MLRKLLIGIGAVFALLIAAVVAIPFFVSEQDVVDRLRAEVRAATGRDLTIGGDIGFSVFPEVAVTVEGVAFADAPWTGRVAMFEADRLAIGVALLPAISGDIQIKRFILDRPVVTLETAADGRTNWSFESAAPTTPSAAAPAESGGAGASFLQDLSLGDVALNDGRVTVIDRGAQTEEVFETIDIALSLPGLDAPFAAEGAATWRGEALSFSLETGAPRGLLDGARTPAEITLSGDPMELSFDGGVTLGDAPQVNGAIDLAIPSLRGLVGWASAPLPDDLAPGALGPVSISGVATATPSRAAFENAALSFDDIEAAGSVAVGLSGPRPSVSGRLDVETLDLNPYLGGADQSGGGGGAPATTGGAAADEGWSDAPIDAAILKAFDAELALSANRLIVDAIEIGRSELDIAVKAGRMNATLRQLALYDGVARGRLAVDGSQPELGVDLEFSLDGVQAFPLLQAAADLERLEGAASGTLAAKARGRSQRALVSSLSGTGDLKFVDGAILGIDIAGTARTLFTAGLAAPTERPKTDFAELTGSYTIQQGVLRNDDLSLLAPLLRVGGEGTVDLPARRMDYCLKPRLVASLQGQGGDRDQAGVKPIAILVDGPWTDLSPSPRFFACDPAEAARMAARAATSAPLDAVRSILPGVGAGAPADGAAGGGAPASPADALREGLGGAAEGLRGLFGR
ncbi:MAG: AsmA family protein [Pseudomonadota bacterium]